jgi:hypothetical protein
MEKWIHVRQESDQGFNPRTGEKLPVEYTSWIRNEAGAGVGIACDDYTFNGPKVIKTGAIERGNLMAAAPEAVAFAKRMAEYFANNPNGYDDLREECQAVLQKAFPAKEVACAG